MNIPEFEMTQQQVISVQYPDLSNYVHHQNPDEIIQQPSNRKEFLLKFYKNSLIQFAITLGVYLLGFSDTFLSIVTVFEQREWASYYKNYEHYKSSNTYSSYNDYLEYLESHKYTVTFHRWTYYLFLGLLIVNALILVLGRTCRRIANHQKPLLFSQSILLGLTMLGIAGYYRDTFWKWRKYCYIFICSLSGFMVNSIISITLIKINRLELYHHLKQILIYSTFGINFIVALSNRHVESYVYIIEMFILYAFYYYHQLNNSLLLDPETLPEQQSIFEIIQNHIRPPDHQQQYLAAQAPQISSEYIVLNKKYIIASVGAAILGLLIYFSITSYNPIFKILLIVGSTSIVSAVLDTQVASRSLKEEDHYYAAGLQLIDLFCPLKNIKRSLGY